MPAAALLCKALPLLAPCRGRWQRSSNPCWGPTFSLALACMRVWDDVFVALGSPTRTARWLQRHCQQDTARSAPRRGVYVSDPSSWVREQGPENDKTPSAKVHFVGFPGRGGVGCRAELCAGGTLLNVIQDAHTTGHRGTTSLEFGGRNQPGPYVYVVPLAPKPGPSHGGERNERIAALPHTLSSVNNLAVCICYQGRYAEAEPLFRSALEARRRALGVVHPDTKASSKGLIACLKALGRYEAELLRV